MRHPDAMAQGPGGSGDKGRPLSALGRHQALKAGQWLSEQELLPDQLLHSPALRCVEAAKYVAQAAGLASEKSVCEESLYSCNLDDIERLLESMNFSRVMVLGHNPTMAQVMINAVGRDTFDDGRPVHVPPGYVAYIRITERPVTFAPGVCEVVAQRMPEQQIGNSPL